MTSRPLVEPLPSTAGHCTYDPFYYAPLFAIEDRHFWFRARNRIIAALAGQIIGGLSPGYRVLELGCGTGNVLRVLERVCTGGAVIGMDLRTEGLQYARRRTACPLVQGDMLRLPFKASFDLVGIFDGIEHLPDDTQLLSDVRSILAPGGTLLLTVPAHPSLWSYFDEASHHCRRYELGELKEKLSSAGYCVDYMTQYMAVIYPAVWMRQCLAHLCGRGKAADEELRHRAVLRELRIVPIVNGFLNLFLAWEARVIAGRGHLPIGTSIVAAARKK